MATVKPDKMVEPEPSILRHKAWLWTTFQVPLTNIACLVASCFHHLRKKCLITTQREVILHHTMALRIFARKDTRPKRTTDRIACISFCKLHAFKRKPVNIRCFYNTITSAPHSIATHLIWIYNQDIRLICHDASLLIIDVIRRHKGAPNKVRNKRP